MATSSGDSSNATALRPPGACTEAERAEFARLVRLGFDGSDAGLTGRIRNANCLAFYHAAGGALSAVAALKSSPEPHRHAVFRKAGARVSAAKYHLELGWVFVVPAHRGNRIAERLCEQLLARVPGFGVYAMTRPDNIPMLRILLGLRFVRAGMPYPHPRRHEELALFLRSPRTAGASHPDGSR